MTLNTLLLDLNLNYSADLDRLLSQVYRSRLLAV